MPVELAKRSGLYAYVVEMNGKEMYSQFFPEDQLAVKIEEAKTLYTGVIRIEKAHAKEPPVWVRPADENEDSE